MIYINKGNINKIQQTISLEKDKLRFFIDTTEQFLFILISTSMGFSTYDKNRTFKTIKLIDQIIRKIKLTDNLKNPRLIYTKYDPKYAILFFIVTGQKKEQNELLKRRETYDLYGVSSDNYSVVKVIKILLKKDFKFLINDIPSNLSLHQLNLIIKDLYSFKKYEEIINITTKYRNRLYNDYWGADILDYIAIILTKKRKYGEAKKIFDELKKGGYDLSWKYYDSCNKNLIKL